MSNGTIPKATEAGLFYECGHPCKPGAQITMYCDACRRYCIDCVAESLAKDLDTAGRCDDCAHAAERAACGDDEDDGDGWQGCHCGEDHAK